MSSSNYATYIVDSNTWIRLYEATHPPDVFPSLWIALEAHVASRRIQSPRQVFDECSRSNSRGTLKSWLRNQRKSLIAEENGSIRKEAGRIFAAYPAMSHGVVGDIADPWVVAYGKILGYTVVTEEVRCNSTKKEKRCKIPNICDDLSVDCTTSVKMLRLLGVKI